MTSGMARVSTWKWCRLCGAVDEFSGGKSGKVPPNHCPCGGRYLTVGRATIMAPSFFLQMHRVAKAVPYEEPEPVTMCG